MHNNKFDYEDWSKRNLKGKRTLCRRNSFVGVNFRGVAAGASEALRILKLSLIGILVVSLALALQLVISPLLAGIEEVQFRSAVLILITFFLLTQAVLLTLDIRRLSLRLSFVFLSIFVVTLILSIIGIIFDLGSFLGGTIVGFIILNILIVESICFSIFVATVIALNTKTNSIRNKLSCFSTLFLSTSSSLVLALFLSQRGATVPATIFSSLLIFATNSLSYYLGLRSIKDRSDVGLSPFRRLAITLAAYGGTSFEKSDLNDADFSSASLYNVDLRHASMIRTCWYKVKGLEYSLLDGTYLQNPIILRLVTSLQAEGINFDGFNLSGLNLKDAQLDGTSLVGTDLRNADLREASITGACIENLIINKETKLDGIKCEYLYLTADRKKRFPQTGLFEPGECSLFLKIALNTVDIVFPDGIDWHTFYMSFQALRSNYRSTDIAIQAIEKKRNGDFLIRLEVPLELDLKKIESDLRLQYEKRISRLLSDNQHLKTLSERNADRAELYMQQNADFSTVIKQLAITRQLPTTIEGNDIEVNIVTGNQENEKKMKITQNFNADVNAVAANVEGNMNVNAAATRSNLVQSAQEIQALLNQLSETYNIVEVPAKALDKIEKNPPMKARLLGAIQSGGKAALKELVKHPAINILLASVDGWEKS